MKYKLAAIGIGSLLSLGLVLPLAAQEDVPDVLENDQPTDITDDPELIEDDSSDALDSDNDVGLPDGVDSPPDSGLPEAGTPTPQGVIQIEVNGESRYYAPINLDESQLEGANIPSYRIDNGGTDNTDAGSNTETESGGMVTYPPADSIEDLEPEDILGE